MVDNFFYFLFFLIFEFASLFDCYSWLLIFICFSDKITDSPVSQSISNNFYQQKISYTDKKE